MFGGGHAQGLVAGCREAAVAHRLGGVGKGIRKTDET